jgi:AcrR family transcriptional regulator
MSNKETILQTALDLFNAMGTARVTTNLIAKEAGISPGNLYYHFTDKEHIIREIFELMAADWDRINASYMDPNTQFEGFINEFVRVNFELLWKYRFFSREMVPLINADSELKNRHVPVINAHFEQQYTIMRQAVDAGIIHFPDPAFQAKEALTIAWIVSNQYLNYLEGMGNEIRREDFAEGANLVMSSLRPYLSGNHIIRS